MPITRHERGLTFSGKFEFEAFLWLEHPGLTAREIETGLAVAGDGDGGWVAEAQCNGIYWTSRIEPAGDLPATLAWLADRLATPNLFLDGIRAGGGRFGCRVICKVDFNAQFILDSSLLRRLAALGLDLTIHALDVETPETAETAETAEGMRHFLEIMNNPPRLKGPVTDPPEASEADPDAPP